jgi:uncharacterized protein YecT (DUF1311 family)
MPQIIKITTILCILFIFNLSACNKGNISIAPTVTPRKPIQIATLSVDCTTAMTQLEMNICAGRRAQAEYAKLNSLISELGSRMDTFRYLTLLQIESDWEKTAQAHCEWVASFFEGGSVQPLQHQGCLVEQYQQRIKVLKIMLCEGAGMTGECEASSKYEE